MEKIEVSNNEVKKKKKNNGSLIVLLAITLAFAAGLAAMYFFTYNNPKIITKTRDLSEIKVSEEAIEDAIEKVYDAVLCIEVLDGSGQVTSTGTGFVYDEKGYVLTNAHVVTSGASIQGTLSNKKVVSLTLLGSDSYTDLAVLKMDAKEVLQVASLGSSANMKVGNTVFTVGSPMGATYAGTVTKGILSGKDRLVETTSSTDASLQGAYIVKVLQTDAAISPGNSGGPLVNLAGDVIGITSLKLVDSSVEGMGFAIAIEDVVDYVSIIENGKKIERPLLGVQILDLTNKNYLYRYGIEVNTNLEAGVVLVKINDGPANDAGLKPGDIVTKIGDEDVSTTSEFKYELYKHKIGDEVVITYYRNNKEAKVKIKLTKVSE